MAQEDLDSSVFNVGPRASSAPSVDREVERVAPEATPSADDLSSAALNGIWGKLPRITLWDAKHSTIDEATLDRAEMAAKKMEEWIATLEDRRVRKAYQGWVDHYRFCYAEAREELRTHKERDRFRRYCEESDAKRRRVAEIDIPRPK